MKGLIIDQPWIGYILEERKTWEIRGTRSTNLGHIALIQKGSGTIVGVCNFEKYLGPLTKNDLEENIDKHCVPISGIDSVLRRYEKPHAWVLTNVKKLEDPMPYQHRPGAVIWVDLSSHPRLNELEAL